jgi:K+-sensing histidine kinase KdpD
MGYELRRLDASIDGWVRARAMAVLYVAGATIGVISMLLPHSPQADDAGLWSNTALAYMGGALLLALGKRLPDWFFHVALATGTVLVTRAVLISGEPVSFYAVWFIWIGLYAFYFFTRAAAAAHLGFAAAAYALTLTSHTPSSPVARWLTMLMTMLVAGGFIDTLVRRARRQGQLAADSAAALATVADVAHELARLVEGDSVRQAACAAGTRLSGADTVGLWEPAATGTSLQLKGFDGPRPAHHALAFVSAPAGSVRAFTSGEPVIGRGELATGSPEYAGDPRPPRACIWQPVLRDGVPVAVLAFYWQRAAEVDNEALRTISSLLAVEVGVTLERVELLSRLESIARTDDLTGLPNRRAWEQELPRELLRPAARAGRCAWR